MKCSYCGHETDHAADGGACPSCGARLVAPDDETDVEVDDETGTGGEPETDVSPRDAEKSGSRETITLCAAALAACFGMITFVFNEMVTGIFNYDGAPVEYSFNGKELLGNTTLGVAIAAIIVLIFAIDSMVFFNVRALPAVSAAAFVLSGALCLLAGWTVRSEVLLSRQPTGMCVVAAVAFLLAAALMLVANAMRVRRLRSR